MEVPQKELIHHMIQQSLYWVFTPKTSKLISETYLHTVIHSSIIHSGQDVEATEVSYNR